jgi:phosphotransferase system HPr (HPr) family protein
MAWSRPRKELGVSASSEIVVELPDEVDLHARPAANFVRVAMQFDAEITVAADDRDANAKSLLAVLALGARGGSALRLSASGADADRALEDLSICVGSLQ